MLPFVGAQRIVVSRARNEPVVVAQIDQMAIGERDRGERVAGTDRLHALAAIGSAAYHGDQFLLGTGPVDL